MQRQELIEAVHRTRDNAERIASDLHEDGWNTVVHGPEGWNVKQVYAHLASTATISATIAKEGLSLPEGFDIDALNAHSVGERESKRVLMLMAEIDSGMRELAQNLHHADDAFLNQQVPNPIQPGTTIALIDILGYVSTTHVNEHLSSVEAALKPA
jgi:hypothetical protein